MIRKEFYSRPHEKGKVATSDRGYVKTRVNRTHNMQQQTPTYNTTSCLTRLPSHGHHESTPTACLVISRNLSSLISNSIILHTEGGTTTEGQTPKKNDPLSSKSLTRVPPPQKKPYMIHHNQDSWFSLAATGDAEGERTYACSHP